MAREHAPADEVPADLPAADLISAGGPGSAEVAGRAAVEDTVGVPDSGHAASAVRTGAMIGRDDELRRGTELARDAAAGRGRLLLIQGEPGIGKTMLLRNILDQAADLIPQVVS